MNSNKDGRRFATHMLRRLTATAALTALLTLLAVAGALFLAGPHPTVPETGTLTAATAPAGAGAWGQEAVSARGSAWSPIPVANACGLGASSCFKCHNGSRAAAPRMDKQNGEWHAQHQHVNDDCVGCHAGNPRIIKKELAHANLVADPRTQPARCAACHKSEDITALMKPYQKTK